MSFSNGCRRLAAPAATLGLLATGQSAFCDRLIDIPTARKLPYGDYRIEYSDQLASSRTQLGYLDMGIGTSFEASIRTQQLPGRSMQGTVDVTYNYISPISGISPGIAFGVQDALNATSDGRRFFFCVTYRDEADAVGGNYPMEVTLGAFFANRSSPFLGLSIPFSGNVRFVGEHDGIRLSAGFEYRPIHALGVRLLSRGNDLMGGLSWMGHF